MRNHVSTQSPSVHTAANVKAPPAPPRRNLTNTHAAAPWKTAMQATKSPTNAAASHGSALPWTWMLT